MVAGLEAVVAIVGEATTGYGRAITVYQASTCFSSENLAQLTGRFPATLAGEVARSGLGLVAVSAIPILPTWSPRSRGVSIDSESRLRFRGRMAALQAIRGWLDRDKLDRRVLVVTGDPGSGKSAVLGRIVTTADPDAARQLPSSDAIVRASPGSVACAVHAKGKTALEIATEIARAASAALPEIVEDFAPALRRTLSGHTGRRFNVNHRRPG